ncbi:C40 family peptidase [Xanthomonas hyacinthi]|uniref:C40 family peptidase n=1 Tax=Xanthomonas hyacinthi TaxID=56455 RepID=UPI00062D6CBC|nr:C40 family peptidase [Xanthomonas hyacinthi]KLD74518.1 glycoside hydrolase [Xanthomonas hyacinthi DSM 19077]
MTTEAKTSPGKTTVPRRAAFRLICTASLCLSAVPALAQSAPADSVIPEAIATVAPAQVTAAGTTPSTTQPATAKPAAAQTPATARSKADAAATATLAALLPHLAANDTIPLMDRSAMFAGDISRLLANYDVSQAPLREGVVPGGDKVQSVLKRAMALLGTPYRWGGEDTEGFDCSGLVGYVFRTALGIELPRVSREMAHEANAELIKDRDALAPGDLVFFGRKGRVDHVGLYVGEGRFLHAPSRGKDVRVDTLTSGYWGEKFVQARRVAM